MNRVVLSLAGCDAVTCFGNVSIKPGAASRRDQGILFVMVVVCDGDLLMMEKNLVSVQNNRKETCNIWLSGGCHQYVYLTVGKRLRYSVACGIVCQQRAELHAPSSGTSSV